jgi:hypothetical protein
MGILDMDRMGERQWRKTNNDQADRPSIEFIKTDGRGFEDDNNQDDDIPI